MKAMTYAENHASLACSIMKQD